MEEQGTLVSQLLIRHGKSICLLWALISIVLLFQVPDLRQKIDISSRWDVGESVEVGRVLSREFPQLGRRHVVVVLSGVKTRESEDFRLFLFEFFDAFRELPFVTGVDSPLTLKDSSLFLSDEVAIGFIRIDESIPLKPAIEALRETARTLHGKLMRDLPGAKILITGSSAIDYDTIELSNSHIRTSELIALPLIIFLLIWVFGTFTAAVLPVLLACLAIGLSLGCLSVIASHVSISVVAQSMASLLGLALGTDYALLLVTSFREQLVLTGDARTAAEQSLKEAGTTIFLSGSAIVIGLSALIIIPANELRSVAISGVLVATLSVLLATTLLPLVLYALGEKINSGKIRRSLIGRDHSTIWRKWSTRITARPYLAVTFSLLFLLLLALPSKDLKMSFPDKGWMSPAAASVQGVEVLRNAGKSGLIYRLTMVYQHPAGQASLDEAGWEALKAFRSLIEKDQRIDQIISLTSLVPGTTRVNQLKFMLTEEAIRRFTNTDQNLSLIEIIPRSGLEVEDLIGLVEALRGLDTSSLSSPPISIKTAGLPAATYDYLQLLRGWAPIMVWIVVVGTLLVLFIGFKSFLVPIKAVILNLLTVAATFGVFQMIFIAGHGSWIFGLSAPLEGVFPAIPLLVFCTVFGISMDYEIFLIRRVQQARMEARTEKEAVISGLASTSRVITNAALIMIAVFGAFAVGDFLPVTMLGVALAVAIILDATVIRMVLSPALLCIAGRWNWWPGKPPIQSEGACKD